MSAAHRQLALKLDAPTTALAPTDEELAAFASGQDKLASDRVVQLKRHLINDSELRARWLALREIELECADKAQRESQNRTASVRFRWWGVLATAAAGVFAAILLLPLTGSQEDDLGHLLASAYVDMPAGSLGQPKGLLERPELAAQQAFADGVTAVRQRRTDILEACQDCASAGDRFAFWAGVWSRVTHETRCQSADGLSPSLDQVLRQHIGATPPARRPTGDDEFLGVLDAPERAVCQWVGRAAG